MGLFDWLGRRGSQSTPPPTWHVYCEGSDIVAEDGRGGTNRVPLAGARSVRVVPLMAGNHHGGAGGGWQVTLARSDGDELTEKMFSRVGQFTPTEET